MKLKVQCSCETRFEFEVEPVNGRMPMPVHCPTCGRDTTDFVNAMIKQQLEQPPAPLARVFALQPQTTSAPAPVEKPRVRMTGGTSSASVAAPVATSTPPAPPQARPISATPSLRISSATGQAAEATPTEVKKMCPKHLTEPAEETCRVCGKPMCRKCMELFGYVCSVFCREKAERSGIEVPLYAHQKSVVQRKASAKTRRAVLAVAAGFMAIIGVWIWYAFVGSEPHVIYSAKIPKSARGTFYHLLAPNELLSYDGKQLALFDVKRKKQLWSTPFELKADNGPLSITVAGKQINTGLSKSQIKTALKGGAKTTNSPPAAQPSNSPPATAGAAPGSDSDDDDDELFGPLFFEKPRVVATSDDLWLLFADRIVRFDRRTGSAKPETLLEVPVVSITHNENAILAISEPQHDHKIVTRIALPAGTVQTEEINLSSTRAALAKGGKTVAVPNIGYEPEVLTAAAGAYGASVDPSSDPDIMVERYRHEFVAADPTAVEVKIVLVKYELATHQAMKPKGKPVLESQNFNASMGLDAAAELLNDMKRDATGGVVKEDISRYQVTLRRWLTKDAPTWTGEVIGKAGFYPGKTVDVLAAGHMIYVFDKSNRKLWESKLTYPVTEHFSFYSDEAHSPFVETADSLYMFDQGMLTRFDLKTGEAKWRVTSVGISRMQLDGHGHLYVNTTTADPESLQYSEQIDVHHRVQPLLMKVDAASGKVLWKQPRIAEEFTLSGKYVYASRISATGLFNTMGGGGGSHFNLYRVNPSSGKQVWHLYESRWPAKVDIEQNWILLQFRDEVQVLKYLSF